MPLPRRCSRSANTKHSVDPRPSCTRMMPYSDSVTKAVETHCGIASNFGKTRAFALGLPLPPPAGGSGVARGQATG